MDGGQGHGLRLFGDDEGRMNLGLDGRVAAACSL
jgi:hypothetical protein